MRPPASVPRKCLYVMIPVAIAITAGCAGPPAMVRPGDQAAISFTCRFANGELAASSSSTIGLNDGRKRSSVFLPRETSDPIILEAGTPGQLAENKVRPMEEEALQQLRNEVIGLKEGEERQVDVHSSINRTSIIKYNRVLTQPKERRLKVEEFKSRTGAEPKVGDEYEEIPGFPGSVTAVTDNDVVVGFPAAPKQAPQNFFGPGTVADEGDQYRVTYATEKGKLVRSGYLVGRVVGFTDSTVSIDFGDPFAGETLRCEVRVESVKPAAVKQPAMEKPEIRTRDEDEARERRTTGLRAALQDLF